jgi:dienelactone hydrolase
MLSHGRIRRWVQGAYLVYWRSWSISCCQMVDVVCRLADRLAQAGYLVVIPDLIEGDTGKVPLEVDPDLASWSRTHIDDGVYAGIKIILKAMRNKLGVKKIGAMGFSDSARSVIRFLAFGMGVDAGFVVMPSFATILPTEVSAIARPLSIAAAGMKLHIRTA